MFTKKDLEIKTIFVINCISDRNMRVSNGELLLEETDKSGNIKTLTKMPFQKILALFVIGNISITTPLIEKCKKFNVALIVMKYSLRPVFFWSDSAEANYILRKKQHLMDKNDISIAKVIVKNKITNQIQLLKNTRKKDPITTTALNVCDKCLLMIDITNNCNELMGVEGLASRNFFMAYYQDLDWVVRRPRGKCDEINVTLDIGYTILFNFVESFVRMFGFDIYIGVFHKLWFKRKSLICDIMEPFRCIIDKTVRIAFNRNQFNKKDFMVVKGEYVLKHECSAEYYKLFFNALIPHKNDIFCYVHDYYRSFMRSSAPDTYPSFLI